MENIIKEQNGIKITYDGNRLFRVYKDGRMVAYSDILEEAEEYSCHYIERE